MSRSCTSSCISGISFACSWPAVRVIATRAVSGEHHPRGSRATQSSQLPLGVWGPQLIQETLRKAVAESSIVYSDLDNRVEFRSLGLSLPLSMIYKRRAAASPFDTGSRFYKTRA